MANKPHIIVLGNEKGGSGKSTTAMHVIVSLLREGFQVGSLDLDARQGTLSRYLENRRRFVEGQGLALPLPRHHAVASGAEEQEGLDSALSDLAGADFVVMDCPGSDSTLSRLGHARADTLITPLNDSFIDLDLLARADDSGTKIVRPSLYAEMVWEQKKRRAMQDGGSIDWVVMRNRLSHIDLRSKRQMGKLLDQLGKRIGFRQAPGFGERVIYRELFLKGLTLLDLREPGTGVELKVSHLAARQEVRSLLATLALPQLEQNAAE